MELQGGEKLKKVNKIEDESVASQVTDRGRRTKRNQSREKTPRKNGDSTRGQSRGDSPSEFTISSTGVGSWEWEGRKEHKVL